MVRRPTLCIVALVALAWSTATKGADISPGDFFETKIRPLLAANCFQCHGPTKQESDLRLDLRELAMKGSVDGPVIVPGKPEKSPLIQAVSYHGEIKMPPPPKGKKLPDAAINDLTTWVKMGAPWPDGPAVVAAGGTGMSMEAVKKHWAFQPVREPALPSVKNSAWVQTPLDDFVLARLEAKKLKPAPRADRRTLIRRATLDLTGLPPTPEEVEAFLADKSPEAFAHVVDRLLASPRYGERWGRYWLDVARYGDDAGYIGDNKIKERELTFAFRFRDWVIQSLNADLPYDQFLVAQIAADLLPHKDNAPLAALGYLTVGRKFINHRLEIIDDRIDVVCRGMMGLTVGCARCHNHKFDPIPQEDYYSLYGVLDASADKDLPIDPKADDKSPDKVMALVDEPKHPKPHVFLRGNENNRGPEVPRRFLAALSGPDRKPFDGSGRLELARRIASPENPLTARVLVNRVWLHHFGEGLVHTPSDFGTRSDPPTHPELLDYLAARFVRDGWSLKKLHRLIMLSSVYQESSNGSPEALATDSENALLAHMNRQRLDFEALRDSLLADAGELDETHGGPTVDILKEPFSRRRTVYAHIARQNVPGLFRAFDVASPDAHSPRRFVTTVPQQALFMMNGPFVVQQAQRLVKRSEIASISDPQERVRRMYRLLFAREPTSDELRIAGEFLAATGKSDPGRPGSQEKLSAWERYAQALLMTNEFVYVD